MAALACTGSRHLGRLFQEHVGISPLDYLHRLRLAVARELLAESDLGIETVAERAGFGSARHLRRIWGKYEAATPSAMRLTQQVSRGRNRVLASFGFQLQTVGLADVFVFAFGRQFGAGLLALALKSCWSFSGGSCRGA